MIGKSLIGEDVSLHCGQFSLKYLVYLVDPLVETVSIFVNTRCLEGVEMTVSL